MHRPDIFNSRGSKMREQILLKNHQLHLGLFKRVADGLGLDASYVSKVAGGTRNSSHVMRLLLKELSVLR